LKIVKLEVKEIYINPELEKLPESLKKKTINVNFHIWRTEAWATKLKKNEELKCDFSLTFVAQENANEIMAKAFVITHFETKPLTRADVNEYFWEFLQRTCYYHCSSILAYYSIGTLMEGITANVFNSSDFTNVKERLDLLWG